MDWPERIELIICISALLLFLPCLLTLCFGQTSKQSSVGLVSLLVDSLPMVGMEITLLVVFAVYLLV